MKAALYARVSTTDQHSIPAQLELMRDYCKQRDWEIIAEFEERETGKKDNRPERAKILNLSAARKIDAVVVWKLSRWGRSTVDLLTTLKELTNRGVAFVSLSEYLDLSTPVGRMVAGVLAVIAEFEREIINENVKMGIAAYRAKHGRWGRRPTVEEKRSLVIEMRNSFRPDEIAKELGISRASVYRLLK